MTPTEWAAYLARRNQPTSDTLPSATNRANRPARHTMTSPMERTPEMSPIRPQGAAESNPAAMPGTSGRGFAEEERKKGRSENVVDLEDYQTYDTVPATEYNWPVIIGLAGALVAGILIYRSM